MSTQLGSAASKLHDPRNYTNYTNSNRISCWFVGNGSCGFVDPDFVAQTEMEVELNSTRKFDSKNRAALRRVSGGKRPSVLRHNAMSKSQADAVALRLGGKKGNEDLL